MGGKLFHAAWGEFSSDGTKWNISDLACRGAGSLSREGFEKGEISRLFGGWDYSFRTWTERLFWHGY
jgi:hypothetical protein